MVFFNPLLFPTLALGAGFYVLGRRLAERPLGPRRRRSLAVLFTVLCLPALSFILYYLHLVPEPDWYVEFRSLPGAELLSAAWGLLFGFLGGGGGVKLRLSLMLAFAPFAKPVLLPLLGAQFNGEWRDGVCIQSTAATCGPCSLATVAKSLSIDLAERDIAKGSFTGMTGTENWYLMRYARRHGLLVRLARRASLAEVVPPAIIGVTLDGGAGHFITYLGVESRRRAIGDPLSGRFLLTDDIFQTHYTFTGTALEFSSKQTPATLLPP